MLIIEIGILFIALVIILAGAELFTNGIEWFGDHLNLAEGAVGSVLAAVGTALPETLIPIIAILFSTAEGGHEIGVGAVLGAPFMLATLAMFVTGVAVLYRGRKTGTDVMFVDKRVLVHDLRYFLLAYGLAIGVAFVPVEFGSLRWIAALALLGIYAWYVKAHFEADPEVHATDLSPLRFHRLDRASHHADPATPRLRIVNLQVLAALGCIIVGAYAFVDAVSTIAAGFGLDGALLALVVAPIATELPEKFNSILWVRQRKDTLAMGNITGAMVFQSAIPTVVALLFASSAWSVTSDSFLAFASAGIAVISIVLIFGLSRSPQLTGRRLLIGGVLYLTYLSIVIVQLANGGGSGA